MSSSRTLMITHKSISWLLITTILLIAFFPAHYHLHHLYETEGFSPATATHEHIIDLHILNDAFAQSHHEEATNITASPDVLININKSEVSTYILLTFILIFLPLISNIKNRFLNTRHRKHKQSLLFYSPPLRAPPQI